ncbi:hypothetical protein C6Y45_11935 [Alkalicoccus saliphilus]|uniref:Uncharacterized protein n=1 Tax=Alkalicoccus saliphilus TaxID=200989 RepID=A0A2T4U4P5_9BACI|nr:hypothetical protein C6Y45_11935 [Alkalicoccus saliphilus]
MFIYKTAVYGIKKIISSFLSEAEGGDSDGNERSRKILSEEAQLRQKQLKTRPAESLRRQA